MVKLHRKAFLVDLAVNGPSGQTCDGLCSDAGSGEGD